MTDVRRRSRAPGGGLERAVASVPLLSGLRASQVERLRACARVRRIPDRETAWSEADPTTEFTFLVSGFVRLVKAGEAGRDAILDLAAPGQLLCSSAVSCHAPYCCSAAAHAGPADVLSIPRGDFMDLLDRDPTLARAFVREAASREMRFASRIAELSSGHLARRIGLLLLRLAQESGQAAPEGAVRIPVALRRQDLADLCGVRVETVIRAMRRLARSGAVRSLPGGFLVKPAALRRLVEGA